MISILKLCVAFSLGTFTLKWLDEKFFKNVLISTIRVVVFQFFTGLVAICSFPLHLVYKPRDCSNAKRCGWIISEVVNPLLGITWEVRGRQYLGDPEGSVIVMNHQSTLDILGMFSFWRHVPRMAPIAKKELLSNPFFGPSAYYAGTVFIDRANSPKAKEQMNETARLMKKDGTKMSIFPEGHRNRTGEMGQFKKGAFHIAISCQVPITPVVFSPYTFINRRTNFFGSGKVIVEALPPVPTEGLTLADMDALMDKVWHLMNEHHKKLGQELKKSLLAEDRKNSNSL